MLLYFLLQVHLFHFKSVEKYSQTVNCEQLPRKPINFILNLRLKFINRLNFCQPFYLRY